MARRCSTHPLAPIGVEGTIVDVEQHGTGRRFLLEDLSINHLPPERTPRRIHLTLSERTATHQHAGDIQPGQRLYAVAQLLPLSEPLTPAGFDFRRNGYFRGIGGTGYILGKMQITENEGNSQGLVVSVNALRQTLQKEVQKTLGGDEAGLAMILLTGDKTFLSPEATEAMRAVGLAHLLAIAGLHVGLVAGIVFFMSRAIMALFPPLALRFPIKKIAAFLAFLAIVFYTAQVGAPVPTRRALLMTSVALLGVMSDRTGLSLRTVALAAFLLLLIWPQLLLHPSFQLSFAAVIGLISVHDLCRRNQWRLFAYREGWFWNALRHGASLGGMSFVATVATLPSGLFHFQEAGIYSMLANTLAIPLTSTLLMPLCVFVDLLWPLGLAWLPLKILGPGIGVLLRLAQNIATLPGAFYKPPTMPIELLAIASLGGLMFCFMTTKPRWFGLGVLVLACVWTFQMPRPDVLISPDGHEVGWRRTNPDALLIASDEKPDHFIASAWAPVLGMKVEKASFTDSGPDLTCDSMGCLGAADTSNVVFIKDPTILPEECARKPDLIVSPNSYVSCANNETRVINAGALRKHGAHALYTKKNGLRIVYERKGKALRPWSVGWRPLSDPRFSQTQGIADHRDRAERHGEAGDHGTEQ